MSRPHRSYRKESLGDWGTIQDEQLTIAQIKLGAILRIADATEAMAKRHTELIRDRDYYERGYRERGERIRHLGRQVAGLRGAITKMKRKGGILIKKCQPMRKIITPIKREFYISI